MMEWKEYKLAAVTEPIKDTYNPDGSDDYTYIGLEHIEQETLRLNAVGTSSDVSSNKFLFNPNDILFGKLRPYFRKVVKPQFSGICSTDIWVLRAKKGFDQNFLYYFIANWDFVNTANSGEGGTRMPRADWNFLKTTQWNFPPLPEQIAIASILSSLDEKVDLLHRQNNTLEQLSETLFKQRFFEEAQSSWDRVALSTLIEIQSGFAFKSDEFVSLGKYKLVTIKNVQDGYLDLSKSDFLEALPLRLPNYCLLNYGDILLSLTGNVGRVCIVDEQNLLLNQRVAKLRPRDNSDWAFTYFLFRQSSMKRAMEELSKGTAQANLSPIDTSKMEISIPPKQQLEKYSIEATPLLQKVLTNKYQIRTLTQLRDTLLPKLMSGEVRVKM